MIFRFQLPALPTDVSGSTYGVAAVIAAVIVFSTLASRRNLGAIPTHGSTSWLRSWVDGFNNGPAVIDEGYRKHKGRPFKVANHMGWTVIITCRKQLDEMRRAPDDELSFLEAVNDRIHVEHLLGREIHSNPYHMDILRSRLTHDLDVLYPEIQDEIVNSFDDILDLQGNEWKSVPAVSTIQKVVCRTSNRVFVGLPLCRDTDWINLNLRFTTDVITGGALLSFAPKLLRPFAAQFIGTVHRSIKRGMELTGPLIEERLKYLEEYGDDWADKPNDLVSWLLEEATGSEHSVNALTRRILAVNVAAIHTSSNSFAHALYYLAANPQYVQPLREEVETIVAEEGWSGASLVKMHKIDSFMKECQRMEGIGALSLVRKAMTDFTFLDGTFIPKGTLLAAPSRSLHLDDEFYENAEVFDPFRFADMREESAEGVKHQFVSTSTEYLAFGHGKHACPGRFFAGNELKSMLAHIVVTYDVKIGDNAMRPPSMWSNTSIVPDQHAKVMFRRRAH